VITRINGAELEIQDTGAPRGERNYWYVSLNAVPIYRGYSRKKAEEVHETLHEALSSTKRGGLRP
jgi:hypothetical protein